MTGVADRLIAVVANRRRLGADLTRAVLAVERTGSMESAPGLLVTIDDPRDRLMESSLLTRPATRAVGSPQAAALRPIDLELDRVFYRLAKASRTGDAVTLTLDHRAMVYMTQVDTPLSASRASVTRAQFIRRQVLEVARHRGAGHKLAFWALELRKRMPVARGDDVSTRAEPDRDVGDSTEAAKAGKGLKLRGRTVDAEQRRNMAAVLARAEQDTAGPKATLALAMACIVEAPDFHNPTGGDASSVGILQLLSSHLGGSTSTDGGRRDVDLVAHLFLTKGFTSLGGAIELARTNPGASAGEIAQMVQGSDFPARYDAVKRDAQRVVDAFGGVAVRSGEGGSYVKEYRFRRDRGENAWENTAKLAEEVGRRRFITIPAPGVDLFVYSSDAGLLALRPQATLSAHGDYIVSEPEYDLDYGRTVRSMRLSVMGDAFGPDFAWGLPVVVTDAGPASGKWLVWDVREVDGRPEVDLELRQPQIAKPEPRSDRVQRADTSDTESDAGADTATGKFVARGKAISDRDYPYVWGGGHAKVGRPDGGTGRDPGTGFDCSGYIGACAHAADMWPDGWGSSVPGSGDFASSWGEPGEGDRLTVWANAGHMFAEVKIPGERVKWIDTSRQAGGASGPHVRYGQRSTAGFTARRWPGT